MALIMLTQNADGGWKDVNDASEPYYVAMSALMALPEPRSVGYAPSIPEILPLLDVLVNTDTLPPVEAEQNVETRETVHEKEEVKLKEAKKENSNEQDKVVRPSTTEPVKPVIVEPSAKSEKSSEEEELETQVQFLQTMLENDGNDVKNVSGALAMHVLSSLAGMPLTVDILKSTGVGRLINKLRKHSAEHVAKAATELVALWKKKLL